MKLQISTVLLSVLALNKLSNADNMGIKKAFAFSILLKELSNFTETYEEHRSKLEAKYDTSKYRNSPVPNVPEEQERYQAFSSDVMELQKAEITVPDFSLTTEEFCNLNANLSASDIIALGWLIKDPEE